MKLLLAMSAMLFTLPAFAAYRTPADAYRDVQTVLAETNIDELELCVGGVCETYQNVKPRKGGVPEVMWQSSPADNDDVAGSVGRIAGALGREVGAGGRLIIDYDHTKTKEGDEHTKVRVEISAGVGSAAAPAAGSGGGGGGSGGAIHQQ